MSARFTITRADGRSNAQVILDYVRDGVPGRLYTYEELGQVLSVGTDRSYDDKAVGGVVRQAAPRLLSEQQRRLHNVKLAGYRLAPASEHMALARHDKRRADTQIRRGVHTLRHVRWDEMDENTRRAHEGHLMITETLYAHQVALDRRLRKVEDAIRAATTTAPVAT